MKRRDFLKSSFSAGILSAGFPFGSPAASSLGFQFSDVTAQAGIQFHHNSGAYGGKLLPETLGSGCAFLDYDADGWPDILIVNSMDWPGHKRQRSTLKLYRNNRNGTFTDVTKAAGLDVELYGMGVAVGDYNNDGFPDLFITCVGQSRHFRNTGKGTFVDVTKSAGLLNKQGFSTSAVWFDYDRDGLLDLFVCNYVRWSAEHDVFCSLDGKNKSYCTPEAYRGDTCWLFHNRGDGSFEDVTSTSGIFDTSSKSLGVAMFDFDQDGWPDLFVANDTQPNKLYRNLRNGKFKDVAVELGLAFSNEGKARAWTSPTSTTPVSPALSSPTSITKCSAYITPTENPSTMSPCKPVSAPLRATLWVSAASSSTPTSTAASISPLPMATLTTLCATFVATSATPSRHIFS